MAASSSTTSGLRRRYSMKHATRYVEVHHCDVHAKDIQDSISNPTQCYRWALNLILSPFYAVFRFVYVAIQKLIVFLFKPKPPPEHIQHPYGRIAVVGAGLTGISSAAHAISHGFEVVIYEATDRSGGIWSRENKTSGLQLNSLLYRFHPAVIWKESYPKRDEILQEIDKIWKEYRLKERTRLNTPVTKVKRLPRKSEDPDSEISPKPPSQWLINDGEDGPFDALIVTIGTCGDPMWAPFEGMPSNAGKVGVKDEAGDQEADGGTKDKHQDGNEVSKAKLHNKAKKRRKHRKKARQARESREEPAAEDAEWEDHDDGQDSDASDTKRSGSPGEEGSYKGSYKGPVLHSSQLDNVTPELLKGKTVVVIGSGASAAEAVETALERGAKKAVVIARADKWIIPRNIIFDTFLAAQPFGREMPLSFLWERILKYWHYHGVEDLMPNKGIFSGTPVVNDEFLNHVRSGKCVYVRGDTLRLTPTGVRVKIREQVERGSALGFGRGVRKPDLQDVSEVARDEHAPEENNKGKEKAQDEPRVEDIKADVVILATGYKRPDISFLPRELFPEGYDRPNLYLQNFSTEDWSVLMTNSSYLNAIGTVGHFHIGIYTRILLTLLLDARARPSSKDMKLWVDAIGFIKRGASGGALSFFTYMELMIWLLAFHIFRPDRLLWLPFIILGWGMHPDDPRLLRLKTESQSD